MQRKMQRAFGSIPAAFSLLAAGVFLIVVLILVLAQSQIQWAYGGLSLLSNAALYPAALAGIALLFWLRSREKPAARASSQWPVIVLFLMVLAAQFLIARSCWYRMGWDILVVNNGADSVARGTLSKEQIEYYQMCPNNAPLTMLQAIPLWVALKIGLAVPFVVLPYIDAVLLNLSAFLGYQCVRLLSQSRVARGFALVVSIGWIALSPYILYPYTDSFAILFPVLALYVYLRFSRPVLKWFLISLLCFFGASIKPTVLILLIALAILGVCRFLAQADFSLRTVKMALLVCIAVIVGAIPGRVWQNETTAYLAGSAVPEGQLCETHYLMLGMNGDTYGGHSQGDNDFSLSYETLSERRAATLNRAWERLTSRSLLENLRFFGIKAYKAYGDGSFAAHTSFIDMEIPKRTDALSLFLRSFYHHRGSWVEEMHTLVQCLWLGLLSLCAVAAVRLRKHPAVAVLSLTLLGLTAYLLLFEVWPRYAFLYAPFFLVLASLAFDQPIHLKKK